MTDVLPFPTQDARAWASMERETRAMLDGFLPPQGIDWVIGDLKSRYQACASTVNIHAVFDAAETADHGTLRGAVVKVVQGVVNPWVAHVIALEVELYRALNSHGMVD